MLLLEGLEFLVALFGKRAELFDLLFIGLLFLRFSFQIQECLELLICEQSVAVSQLELRLELSLESLEFLVALLSLVVFFEQRVGVCASDSRGS